ncbi:MAG: hypothetical protein M0R48_04310 [Candidatus Omnitrophica bacterium]|jgi:hypothetical protein|nr:hypothetical protein [Candidatus Omnitrophota bacterium]
MEHPFHEKIGDLINNTVFPNCKIIKDPACGGGQHIPLFCSGERSRETEYCNVDLLITVDNKIKVIIEIEEANIKPTQICGKLLTSALSKYFIHESEGSNLIGMADSVLFIQVLDSLKLKIDKTAKTKQWDKIEKSIQDIIPVKGSNISRYKIFYGNKTNFNDKGLLNYISEFLKQ